MRAARKKQAAPSTMPKAKSRASATKTRRAPATSGSKERRSTSAHRGEWWELRLYIAGQTPRSLEALANLQRICEEHLHGRYRIEVVDLLVNPTLARGDQILAVPTLVRQLPPPVKKIIGDFANTERVLVGLNLRPLKGEPPRRTRP